jgi:hypothetical protein
MNGGECVDRCPFPLKEPNSDNTTCVHVCGEGYHRNTTTDECVTDQFRYLLYGITGVLIFIPMIYIAWAYMKPDKVEIGRGEIDLVHEPYALVKIIGTWLPLILLGVVALFVGEQNYEAAAIMATLLLIVLFGRIIFYFIDTIMYAIYIIPGKGPAIVKTIMGKDYMRSHKGGFISWEVALKRRYQSTTLDELLISKPGKKGWFRDDEEEILKGSEFTDHDVHEWKQRTYTDLEKNGTITSAQLFTLSQLYYIPVKKYSAAVRGMNKDKQDSYNANEVKQILTDSIVDSIGKYGEDWRKYVGEQIYADTKGGTDVGLIAVSKWKGFQSRTGLGWLPDPPEAIDPQRPEK